jgi:hypothetical protein
MNTFTEFARVLPGKSKAASPNSAVTVGRAAHK